MKPRLDKLIDLNNAIAKLVSSVRHDKSIRTKTLETFREKYPKNVYYPSGLLILIGKKMHNFVSSIIESIKNEPRNKNVMTTNQCNEIDQLITQIITDKSQLESNLQAITDPIDDVLRQFENILESIRRECKLN